MKRNQDGDVKDTSAVRLGAGNIDFRRRRRPSTIRPDADIADDGKVQITAGMTPNEDAR